VSGPRVFLLSPAFCGGRRARILLREGSTVPIARRLQAGELTLGEAFAFMSGLYFRGKLTYSRAFGRAIVITPSRGLMDPDVPIDAALIHEFAATDVSLENPVFRAPLERDAATLAATLASALADAAPVVLLGSVATGKYVDVLAPRLGDRLRYPAAFVGRGDMSRGGLLLRSAESGEELVYEPLRSGVRVRGARPPKLEPRSWVVQWKPRRKRS
jgi:hypothetical protein